MKSKILKGVKVKSELKPVDRGLLGKTFVYTKGSDVAATFARIRAEQVAEVTNVTPIVRKVGAK